jgi:hypothetical protein
MSRAVRVTLWLVALATGLGGAAPAAIAGVQTSASLSVVPSDSGPLENGDVINLEVIAHNHSSNTPPNAVLNVPATITGPITVQLGCLTCDCSVNDSRIQFMAGPVTGCVAKDGAVTSCAAGPANTALINLAPAGIVVPAGGSVSIATIKVMAVVDPVNGPFLPSGIRASTDDCAVTACVDGTPASGFCVDCAAEGCTKVLFEGGPPLINCPHPCPNKIRFRAGPDFFEFHAIIEPVPGYDPEANGFNVTLSNVNGQIFALSLPVGSINCQSDACTFNNSNADNVGGVAFVKSAARDDVPGQYRIDIRGYVNGLDTATTNPDRPDMTFTFDIGGQSFTSGQLIWQRTSFGWQRISLTPP